MMFAWLAGCSPPPEVLELAVTPDAAHREAAAAIAELEQRDWSGTLRITLAPGVYTRSLELLPESEPPRIDVSLVAGGEVWFDGASIEIGARSAYIEGVRFRGLYAEPALDLRFDRLAEIRALTFVDAHLPASHRGPPALVRLSSGAPGAPSGVQARLDGWRIVDVDVHDPRSALVRFEVGDSAWQGAVVEDLSLAAVEPVAVFQAKTPMQIEVRRSRWTLPAGARLLDGPPSARLSTIDSEAITSEARALQLAESLRRPIR